MYFICSALILGFVLHAGDFSARACQGRLVSVRVQSEEGEQIAFTGVVRRATLEHLNFGTVVVPRSRIDPDQMVMPEPGDLITFLTPELLSEGTHLRHVVALFNGLRDGRIDLNERHSVSASRLIGGLTVIPRGRSVRLSYLDFSPLDLNRPRLRQQTIIITYDGPTGAYLKFGELHLMPHEVIDVYLQ